MKKIIFLFFFLLSFRAAADCDGVLCVKGGDVFFESSFVTNARDIGINLSSQRKTVDPYMNRRTDSFTQDDLNQQMAGDPSTQNQDTGQGQQNQQGQNSFADSGAGANGFGGGNSNNGGFGNFDQASNNNSDTFQGFNNFDGSAEQNSRGQLDISGDLANAINQQGTRKVASLDAGQANGDPVGESNGRVGAAAYLGGGGNPASGGYGSPSGAQGQSEDGGGEDNSLVTQAAQFFKGAFGLGGSSKKSGRGFGKNRGASYKSSGKKSGRRRITKSPEQILRDKWRRLQGRRGLASVVPQGMLDRRTNIFHGMCKEYSSYAEQMGQRGSGYCPPAQ